MANDVVTFDMVNYSLPEIQPECEVILTKDCSTKQGIFTILAKPSETRDERHIKILIPKHKVELLLKKTEIKILIDGEEKTIREDKPELIRDDEWVFIII